MELPLSRLPHTESRSHLSGMAADHLMLQALVDEGRVEELLSHVSVPP